MRRVGHALALSLMWLGIVGCSGGRGQSTGSSDRDADVGVAVSDIAGILTDTALADASNKEDGAAAETTDVVDGPDNGLGEPWPPEDVVAVFDSLPYSIEISGTFGIPGRFGEIAYCELCEGVRPFAFLWAISGSQCLTDTEKGCQQIYDSPEDTGALVVDMAMRGQSGHAHTLPGAYASDYESFNAESENLQVVTTWMHCLSSSLARVLWQALCRQRIDHSSGPMLIEYPVDRVMSCCGDGTPPVREPGEAPGINEVMVIYRFPKSCGSQSAEHQNTLESMFARGDDDSDLERHYCYPLSDEFIEAKPKNEL